MAGETVRSEPRTDQGAAEGASTARVLGSLPADEWRIFHDVRWPGRRYADIDHVAIGPSGVFVVDTRAWSGRIDVKGGSLRQDGKRRSRTVIASAAAAMAVCEALPGLNERAVNPVLCFVREEPVFGWSGDVMICSTENVVTFLTSRPRLFNEAEVADVAGALSIAFESAPAVARSLAPAGLTARPDVATPGRAKQAGRAGQPRRSRQGRLPRGRLPGHVRVAVGIGVFAVVAALGFRFDLPSRIGDLSSKAAQEVLAPTEPIGTAVAVPAMRSRPSLEVTAGRPVLTRSTVPGIHPSEGQVLVAVPLSIENTGHRSWHSTDDVRMQATDGQGFTYSSDPGYTSVASGYTLPSTMTVRAGDTRRGVVVFEVPRGTRVAKVEARVGPELPKTLRWKVG
jgi:hypothetical protein